MSRAFAADSSATMLRIAALDGQREHVQRIADLGLCVRCMLRLNNVRERNPYCTATAELKRAVDHGVGGAVRWKADGACSLMPGVRFPRPHG